MTGYDEISEIGNLFFGGCDPLADDSNPIGISVGTGHNYAESIKTILLDCHCPDRSVRYTLTEHQAMALANLIMEACDD